jgi:hypothetical protein
MVVHANADPHERAVVVPPEHALLALVAVFRPNWNCGVALGTEEEGSAWGQRNELGDFALEACVNGQGIEAKQEQSGNEKQTERKKVAVPDLLPDCGLRMEHCK